MSLAKLPRLFRTVRHLRASQLMWRARYAVSRRWPLRRAHRRRGSRILQPVPIDGFASVPLFTAPGPAGEVVVDELLHGRLTQLNRTVDIGRARPDWQLGPRSSDRLWTITLHYHRWAHQLAQVASGGSARAEEAAQLFRHYVGDWIERCGVGTEGARHLAWNSFAIATRLGWWIRAWLLMEPVHFPRWQRFRGAVLGSLREQAMYLHRHLEWDLRGNHVARDLVGLAWAGRFLDGPEARDWLEAATRLTGGQLRDQILPDGAHYERSPMYHLQIMQDLLALEALLAAPQPVDAIRTSLIAMAEHLSWMRHPDGGLALFNDGARRGEVDADGVLCHLLGSAQTPRGGRFFPDAGMVAWHGDIWTAFVDVGVVGPSEQPGHAHADTLSLECSHRGQLLFVNPGCHGYDDDRRRHYDRSTAAHNTVCIDGLDSSEVWHIFRVGRRAVPQEVRVAIEGQSLEVSAAHDGYGHLSGSPRHRRRVSLREPGPLVIVDSVEGRGRHRVEGGLLVAPGWSVAEADRGWAMRREGRVVRIVVGGPASTRLAIADRPYHPEYGCEIMSKRLVWGYEGHLPVEVQLEIE